MFTSTALKSAKIVPKLLVPKASSKFVFGSASRAFATYKSSTGLVGLNVDPEGRTTLNLLAKEVLESVKKIPEGTGYRTSVDQWFTFIEKVTTELETIKEIEDEIEQGQIEEVIEIAKEELKLIEYYYENKGWERVEHAQNTADAIVEDMADSIYFSSPESRPAPKATEPPK